MYFQDTDSPSEEQFYNRGLVSYDRSLGYFAIIFSFIFMLYMTWWIVLLVSATIIGDKYHTDAGVCCAHEEGSKGRLQSLDLMQKWSVSHLQKFYASIPDTSPNSDIQHDMIWEYGDG